MTLVEWRTDDGIATLTLADPARRNALSAALRADAAARFDEFERRADLRVLIVAARGPVFCAGGDLAEMPAAPAAARRFLADVLGWLQIPERIGKPVIAAVDGPALGGGFELAMSCDVIVASERASFGTPEALAGLAPAFAMVRLPSLIGPALTKQLAFTGRAVSAAEAHRLGLVAKLAPAGQAFAAALELAESMLAGAPLAHALVKSAVNRDYSGAGMAHAREAMAQLFMTRDAQEGISAFRDKRPPVFTGC